ncbi:hypothetical protein, partial [Klebsiella pneumoniae]|uniref:hypothetical protein n=1 Tax=Klebsiella pneumoniae TaxID=573 RepID=UPI003F8D62FA
FHNCLYEGVWKDNRRRHTERIPTWDLLHKYNGDGAPSSSATRTEFKNLEFFYFHNCLYEGVWKDNRRRHTERIPTWDLLHKYNGD